MRRVSWQRLSTKVVIMQVAILVVTLAADFAVVQWNLKRQLDQQFEHRALAVAQSLASQPAIADAVIRDRPGGEAQRLAMAAMKSTKALFVVITDAKGIRYSHRHPWLIGTPVTYHDPEPAYTEPFRTGKPWVGIQTGRSGRSPPEKRRCGTTAGSAARSRWASRWPTSPTRCRARSGRSGPTCWRSLRSPCWQHWALRGGSSARRSGWN